MNLCAEFWRLLVSFITHAVHIVCCTSHDECNYMMSCCITSLLKYHMLSVSTSHPRGNHGWRFTARMQVIITFYSVCIFWWELSQMEIPYVSSCMPSERSGKNFEKLLNMFETLLFFNDFVSFVMRCGDHLSQWLLWRREWWSCERYGKHIHDCT